MDYPHKENGLKNNIKPHRSTTKTVSKVWDKLYLRNPFSFPKYSFSITQSKLSAKVPESNALEPAPKLYQNSKNPAVKTPEHSSYNHLDKEISPKTSNDSLGKENISSSRVNSSTIKRGQNKTLNPEPKTKPTLEPNTIQLKDETMRKENDLQDKM